MRIGIIHGNFESLGGSEQVAISLIKCFKKSNHKINLYFVNYTNDELIQTIFKDILQFVKIHKIFQLNTKNFTIYRRLINRILLTKAGNKNDIVIETSGVLYPLWSTSKPYIVYCNGFSKEVTYNIETKSKLKKIYVFPYNKALQKFQKKNKIFVISNSNYTKKLLKNNLGIDSTIIYPPVEINKFQNNLKKEPRSIITVSRYSPGKKIDLAIDIINNFPNISFKVIGNAYTQNNYEYYNQIKEKTKKYSHIELLCNIKRDELIKSVSQSKVYLHTSEETFGISVVEAIAAGCIPIVPNNSAHKETVPFEDLRYDDINQVQEKIFCALEGKFNNFLPKLREHIQNFSEESFQKKMISYIENQE